MVGEGREGGGRETYRRVGAAVAASRAKDDQVRMVVAGGGCTWIEVGVGAGGALWWGVVHVLVV